jgi:hypothetical protein
MTLALRVYFILAALHFLAVIVSGILWAVVDIRPTKGLRENLADIRAVHFGNLYLAPMMLCLAWAFDRLQVPEWHWWFFPGGLWLLVVWSSLGYVFPKPAGVAPFYYWTKGPALVLAVLGMACAIGGILWTAGVLAYYAVVR